mgnify:CR=1 FL=1
MTTIQTSVRNFRVKESYDYIRKFLAADIDFIELSEVVTLTLEFTEKEVVKWRDIIISVSSIIEIYNEDWSYEKQQ